MAALFSVLQRLEELHPATLPGRSRRSERLPKSMFRPTSRRASPANQYFPHRQSAPDIRAPPGACPRFAVRPLASLRRAPVQVPLTVLQQAYQSATPFQLNRLCH